MWHREDRKRKEEKQKSIHTKRRQSTVKCHTIIADLPGTPFKHDFHVREMNTCSENREQKRKSPQIPNNTHSKCKANDKPIQKNNSSEIGENQRVSRNKY